MKYLKYLQTTIDFESFKNSEDYILPNVSYAKDNNTVYYNPFEEAKSGVIMAHYNVKDEITSSAFGDASNVKSLKVNGETVFSSQITNKTIEVIGSNIVNNGDGTAEFPDEYLYLLQDGIPAKTTIKLKDNSDISSDYYIGNLVMEEGEKYIYPISITEAVNSGFIKVINNTIIVSNDITNSDFPFSFVLCNINEETGDCIFFDTINELEFKSETISSYYFSEVGEYDVEIELIDFTSIINFAFVGCPGLTSITIPDSVTSIGESAFDNCSGLNEITCNAIIAPTITMDTFHNVKSGGVLKVPAGSDYSSWMSTDDFYLGYYRWNILPEDAKVFEIYDAITDQEQNSNDTEELFDIVYAKLGEDAIKENKFNTPISVKEATGYDYIVIRAGSDSAKYINTITYISYNAYEDGGYIITIRHRGGNDASVKYYYDNTLTYYTDNIPV